MMVLPFSRFQIQLWPCLCGQTGQAEGEVGFETLFESFARFGGGTGGRHGGGNVMFGRVSENSFDSNRYQLLIQKKKAASKWSPTRGRPSTKPHPAAVESDKGPRKLPTPRNNCSLDEQ